MSIGPLNVKMTSAAGDTPVAEFAGTLVRVVCAEAWRQVKSSIKVKKAPIKRWGKEKRYRWFVFIVMACELVLQHRS